IEWVWGLAEIGLEGYWEQGKTTKAINTISDSYGDFSLYSELVASYGSDKSLVSRDTNSNAGLQVGENTTTWYFSGTWGFKYDNTQYNIVVMAQYYYNGEGYADDSLLGTAESLVIASSPQLTSSDLSYWGIHNFALGWNFSKLDNSDLGVSGLWLIDGSDGSGIF